MSHNDFGDTEGRLMVCLFTADRRGYKEKGGLSYGLRGVEPDGSKCKPRDINC